MIYRLGFQVLNAFHEQIPQARQQKKKKRKNFHPKHVWLRDSFGDCEQVIGYSQVLENQALVNNSTIF